MRTLDDLQNGYALYQETDGFRFGIDAVLLAHFPRLEEGMRILDLGCGTGVIPHILAARARDAKLHIQIEGLELEEKAFACAGDSVAHNDLAAVISLTKADVREAPKLYGPASFLLVTSNPPYGKAGSGKISPNAAKAMARMEVNITLAEWLASAATVLSPGGRFAMVHRPERLAEIYALFAENKLQPVRECLVRPRALEAPNLVLLEAVKTGGVAAGEGTASGADHAGAAKQVQELVIYGDDGRYTDEVLAIYGGKA